MHVRVCECECIRVRITESIHCLRRVLKADRGRQCSMSNGSDICSSTTCVCVCVCACVRVCVCARARVRVQFYKHTFVEMDVVQDVDVAMDI